MTKLRLILRLLRAKKYLLITDDDKGGKLSFNNYHPSELSQSGNAIYIHHNKPQPVAFVEPNFN